MASTFAILSRLEPSKKANMSLIKKMKLYDGEEVEGWKAKDVRELQEEAQREGMDGISPRYIIDRLSNALIRQGVTCINPINALRALRDGFDQHTAFTKEERERYLNLLAETRREYDEMAKKEVQRAFVYAFEESATTLLNNYLDNVEAFCRKEKLKDPLTDEAVEPDEKLMRSIEEQIGVTENGKQTFRESILMAMASPGAPRQDLRVHQRRAPEGGDREEAVRRPQGRDQDHHLDQDARRRAAAADQRGGGPPDDRARLLRRLRPRPAAATSARCSTDRAGTDSHGAMQQACRSARATGRLHRKGPKDQARHQEKVREAIKGQLGEIIGNESIITSDGNKIVKVPVRSLEEYTFRYDPFKKDGVGQGPGGSKPGDVIGQVPQQQPGRGRQAGEPAGHRLLRGRVHHRRARGDDLRRSRPAQPEGEGPAGDPVGEDPLHRRAPEGHPAQPGQEAIAAAGDEAPGDEPQSRRQLLRGQQPAGPDDLAGDATRHPSGRAGCGSARTTCATAPGMSPTRCSATPW